jgi:hypothetical protein
MMVDLLGEAGDRLYDVLTAVEHQQKLSVE